MKKRKVRLNPMKISLMKKSLEDKAVQSDYWTNYIYHPKNLRDDESDFDALRYMSRLIARRENILNPKKSLSRNEAAFITFFEESLEKLNARRLALAEELFSNDSGKSSVRKHR